MRDVESEEKTGEDPAGNSAEAATEEQEPEVEKEYKEKVVPHTFAIEDIGEILPNLRLLTSDQKKEARKRIKALD